MVVSRCAKKGLADALHAGPYHPHDPRQPQGSLGRNTACAPRRSWCKAGVDKALYRMTCEARDVQVRLNAQSGSVSKMSSAHRPTTWAARWCARSHDACRNEDWDKNMTDNMVRLVQLRRINPFPPRTEANQRVDRFAKGEIRRVTVSKPRTCGHKGQQMTTTSFHHSTKSAAGAQNKAKIAKA